MKQRPLDISEFDLWLNQRSKINLQQSNRMIKNSIISAVEGLKKELGFAHPDEEQTEILLKIIYKWFPIAKPNEAKK